MIVWSKNPEAEKIKRLKTSFVSTTPSEVEKFRRNNRDGHDDDGGGGGNNNTVNNIVT